MIEQTRKSVIITDYVNSFFWMGKKVFYMNNVRKVRREMNTKPATCVSIDHLIFQDKSS